MAPLEGYKLTWNDILGQSVNDIPWPAVLCVQVQELLWTSGGHIVKVARTLQSLARAAVQQAALLTGMYTCTHLLVVTVPHIHVVCGPAGRTAHRYVHLHTPLGGYCPPYTCSVWSNGNKCSYFFLRYPWFCYFFSSIYFILFTFICKPLCVSFAKLNKSIFLYVLSVSVFTM